MEDGSGRNNQCPDDVYRYMAGTEANQVWNFSEY